MSKDKLEIMTEGGQILGAILTEVKKAVEPGIRKRDLDDLTKRLCLKYRVKPSFLGYQGYPGAICISLNDEVVHGIPDKTMITNTDLISLDFGVYHEGYHVDAAFTFTFDDSDWAKQKLVETAKEALYLAIDQVKPGMKIGDIGYTIQTYVEQRGFGVVRSLVGHGVGKELHENPLIPNFGQKNTGTILKKGMTLAIEPMITNGDHEVYQENDGWTYKSCDHSLSSHYEHTIYIGDNNAIILTVLPE